MRRRRLLGIALVGGLVLSACSGASTAVSEPSSGTKDSSVAAGPEETTTTTIDDGLASIIDGEPPSTTVSDDPDEQAAADAVYWFNALYDNCLDDPQNCVVADFDEVATGEKAISYPKYFGEFKRIGATADVSEYPPEFTIFWARASETTDGLVGVFVCDRNQTQILKSDGSELETQGNSETDLYLNLMVEGEDGRWRMADFILISMTPFAEDEEDTCSNFDGTELSEEELALYLP